MKLRLKVGPKGQVVIPKPVRESMGIKENGEVMLLVKEKSIELMAFPEEDLVAAWREIAKTHGRDFKKKGFLYGDKLYEEVFG